MKAAAAAILAGFAFASGCTQDTAGRHDLILVSIDTLRADRLGTYGYPRPTSPVLDAFAAEALQFERVVAESSWTLPSHVTMLSGLYPSTHGAVLDGQRPGAGVRLLPEILSESGYTTIGLTDGGFVGEAHGFARGFDRFDDDKKGLAAAVDRAIASIEGLAPDERYFLFLHTYDVHCPYSPAPAFEKLFRSPGRRFVETRGRCGNPHFNQMSLSAGQIAHLSDQYDGSIREADTALARLLVWLSGSGRLERTVVVVTSDHGEEFGEHGQIGHERTLHREALMVPLLLHAPDLSPGRVDEPAGLVDLVPTLLALLDLPAPEGLEGRDLLAPGAASVAAPEGRVSELDRHVALRSIMTRERHLILNRANGRVELYSVPGDPLERNDLAGEEPGRVAELRDALAAYEAARRPRRPEPIADPDGRLEDRLRALGYVE